MTDAELIARLRGYGHVGTVLTAADRIEQLVATNEALLNTCQTYVTEQEHIAKISQQLLICSRTGMLEAKLEKAVEGLEKIAGAADTEWITVSGEAPTDVQCLCDIARAALAEIKSGVATTPYG